MNFSFSTFISLFKSSKEKYTLSSKIVGDNNKVTKNLIITDLDDDIKRELLGKTGSPTQSKEYYSFSPETLDGDDREEIKRILEYRQIANEGNSTTAIALLENLGKDSRYATGYFAFRLRFNIGLIQQNIGELAEASASLRVAYAHCPEDYKAQAGLAFAELLDQEYETALVRASDLLDIAGDHRNLAACIYLHAAKSLTKEVDTTKISKEEFACPEVVAAHLEYMRDLHPDEYSESLNKAFSEDPGNDAIAAMWAVSILDEIKQNQAFLLGARISDEFEKHVSKSAEILRSDLEQSLNQQPPNKLLLPSQANNAAVSLRLSGKVSEAAGVVEKVIGKFPSLANDLAQIRAILLLQEDKDDEALKLIQPLTEAPELQVMASELEAQSGDDVSALHRITEVLKTDISDGLRTHALATKARIGINTLNQNAADEALDELVLNEPESPEVVS